MKKNRKKRDPKIGSIVEIPLPNGKRGYARTLKIPLMAFYAIQSEDVLPINEIICQPIAFKLWVTTSAVSSGRWTVVGHVPLESDLEISPWFFKQDIITKKLSLYRGGVELPATKEQCEGLERAAVWGHQHIESRIVDYLEGRPNKWYNALRIES
jgi:hypothetical protein